MIHRNIGLPSRWESARASITLVRQGIESHRSSFAVGITDFTFASSEEAGNPDAITANIIGTMRE